MDSRGLSEGHGDRPLDEDDHYTILQELEPVAHRWRQIGLALGLRDSTLEIIRARVQPDVYELLGSVIIEWLRANYTEAKYGPPTWRRIVEAVRATSGGRNHALADTLARKYSVLVQDVQPVPFPSQEHTTITENSTEHRHAGILCCCPVPADGTDNQGHDLERDTPLQGNKEEREKGDLHPLLHGQDGSPGVVRSRQNTASIFYSSNRPHSLPDSSLLSVAKYDELNLMTHIQGSKDVMIASPTWQIREITQQRGYWGVMTGAVAEMKLRRHGGNCYLIRYSDSKQHHILSVMTRDAQQLTPVPYHFKLNITQEDDHNEYEIEGTERKFIDISSLLEFYRHNPLTHSSCTIGEACMPPHM